ncbi:hypothetical protein BDR26DRAFT_582533 [Obelidium mucronatum]|nr:hypothetical protein BDR26DRAFT_582533 [Obelidium mucronatum]
MQAFCAVLESKWASLGVLMCLNVLEVAAVKPISVSLSKRKSNQCHVSESPSNYFLYVCTTPYKHAPGIFSVGMWPAKELKFKPDL